MTGFLVLGVAAVAVGSTVFRVATAPERVRDRTETAKRVCTARGGEWVKVDSREHCRLPGTGGITLP